MKNAIKSLVVLGALCLSGQASLAANPAALPADQIVPGFYKSERKGTNTITHEMIIKEHDNNGRKQYFAFFKWGTAQLTSMYEVEASGGSIVFYPIVQTKDFRVMADRNTPIYTTSLQSKSGSYFYNVQWTNNARNFAAHIHCSIEAIFKYQGKDKAWGDFTNLKAINVLSLDGKRNRITKELSRTEGDTEKASKELMMNLTPSATNPNEFYIKTQNFWFETKNAKSFTNKKIQKEQAPLSFRAPDKTVGTVEDIPGLLLAREKTGDAILGIGGAVASEVSYVVLPVQDSSQKIRKLYSVRLSPGVNECGYMTLGVDVDE